MSENDASGTFWEHLDVLRGVLLRSLAVVALLAVVAFCFKETLFAVVLAPRSSDFITFRLLGSCSASCRRHSIGWSGSGRCRWWAHR